MYPGIEEVKGETAVFRQQVLGAADKTVQFFHRLTVLHHPERRKSKRKLFFVRKLINVCNMSHHVFDPAFTGFVGQNRNFVPDHVHGMKFQIGMFFGNRQQNPPGSGTDFNNTVIIQIVFVFRKQTVIKGNIFFTFIVKISYSSEAFLYLFIFTYPVNICYCPPRKRLAETGTEKYARFFIRQVLYTVLHFVQKTRTKITIIRFSSVIQVRKISHWPRHRTVFISIY